MFHKQIYQFVIRTHGSIRTGKVTATSEIEARRVAAYQAVNENGRLLKCEPARSQVTYR